MSKMTNTFSECPWCYGDGCNQCAIERRKYEAAMPKPIFTAKADNPHDMKLLKRVFGKDALEQAFGKDGGGMTEINRNAAIASVEQILHAQSESEADNER